MTTLSLPETFVVAFWDIYPPTFDGTTTIFRKSQKAKMVQRIVTWVQDMKNRIFSGKARTLLVVEGIIVICILVFQYLLLKMLLE